MEILETSESVLCNAEVVAFLREAKAKLPRANNRKHHSSGSSKAATVDSEFPPIRWNLVLGIRGDRDVAALLEPLAGTIGADPAVT